MRLQLDIIENLRLAFGFSCQLPPLFFVLWCAFSSGSVYYTERELKKINERISLGLVVLVAVVHVSSMATSSALVQGTGTAKYDL